MTGSLKIWFLVMFILLPVLKVYGQSLFKSDKAADYEEFHTTWVYPPWKHTWGVVRATQKHLTFFTLGKAKFINPQGLAVVRLTATDDPDKKGDNDEVTVYGVNNGQNSIIYNRSMKKIGLYGYDEPENQKLDSPWDIAATPEGLVFISDVGKHRIVKLRNVNSDLIYEKAFGDGGPGRLQLARGIDVTGGGKVLVADALANRVMIYDTSGVYISAIEELITPVGLAAVDKETSYNSPKNEYFVVSDSLGQRISKYRFDGTLIARTRSTTFPGEKPPYLGHLEIDYYHNIVATDSVNCRILKFDPNLNFLSQWGEEGKGRSKFRGPTGIAMWKRLGQTFVAERGGAHYLWVGVDLLGPPEMTIDPQGPRIHMDIGFTEKAWIKLELVSKNGEVIRERGYRKPVGVNELNWLPNTQYTRKALAKNKTVREPLTPIEPGEYSLRIRLTATYSSRKSFEKVIETTVVFP